jgi:hypothetical protein
VIVADWVAGQLFASKTVTWYVPAAKLLNVAEV